MKRSNSAPMIPELEGLRLKHPAPLATSSSTSSFSAANLRGKRGLSTSNVSLPGDFARPECSPRRQQSLSSPLPFSRINSPTSRQHRVEQLKKEESIDERKNEKEVKERLLLNQSWDDFRLDSEDMHSMELMEVWPPQAPPPCPPQSFVSPSSPLTRMRSRSLTPTSPNSGRTFSYRRSCSPILRPSTLCLGKRKRDIDSEEMDTSPGASSKRLQLGFTSPLNNPSPIVSPLMGNSPLHHSFSTSTASRKSSVSQSESTPLSSPSSLNLTNPFAVNYDSGNLEHWQSGGSSGSSSNHSPSGNTISRSDLKSTSLEEVRLSTHFSSTHSPGIIISDDHRGNMMVHTLEFSPEVNETPTPLSPKGLQFRHKLFQPNLPSPVPRTAHGGIAVASSVISPKAGVSQLSKHSSLHHDKYLSPFDSGLEPSLHGHMTARLISRPKRSHLSASRLGKSRQMLRPEPLKPSLADHRMIPNSSRLVISSPLSKLAVNSGTWDGGAISTGTASSSLTTATHPGDPPEQRLYRKRKESEASNDSREDSLMESDNCSSLEDSIELCGSNKDFDSKTVSSVSL